MMACRFVTWESSSYTSWIQHNWHLPLPQNSCWFSSVTVWLHLRHFHDRSSSALTTADLRKGIVHDPEIWFLHNSLNICEAQNQSECRIIYV